MSAKAPYDLQSLSAQVFLAVYLGFKIGQIVVLRMEGGKPFAASEALKNEALLSITYALCLADKLAVAGPRALERLFS
ncbi:MAG: hypothetical protein KGZ50_09355 [Peptococcaceae bacterium]|nr:hypothetical protein [Peptococcaceae bacterium]